MEAFLKELFKGQDYLPGTEDYPVTYVSESDAAAYCAWRSSRDSVTKASCPTHPTPVG